MSFTLNRVYTEFYRNRGYDFTITSSTAFDHKWIPERNIYDTISVIVDELFADYLSRPNVKQPILTQYCDGRQVQCPNWMTFFAITYKVDFYLFIMLFYVYFTTISCSNPAGWNLHPDIVSDHLTSPVRFSMYSVQQCHQLYVHALSAMFSPHSLFQRQRFHLLCHS